MAKFFGKVGFYTDDEVSPGIYGGYVDRDYYGDITKNYRRADSSDTVNEKISLNNTVSIVADAYALNHFFSIRYVEMSGAKWKVTSVEVQRPRLILSLGGVYNAA